MFLISTIAWLSSPGWAQSNSCSCETLTCRAEDFRITQAQGCQISCEEGYIASCNCSASCDTFEVADGRNKCACKAVKRSRNSSNSSNPTGSRPSYPQPDFSVPQTGIIEKNGFLSTLTPPAEYALSGEGISNQFGGGTFTYVPVEGWYLSSVGIWAMDSYTSTREATSIGSSKIQMQCWSVSRMEWFQGVVQDSNERRSYQTLVSVYGPPTMYVKFNTSWKALWTSDEFVFFVYGGQLHYNSPPDPGTSTWMRRDCATTL